MDGIQLRLDEDAKSFVSDEAWEALGWIERTMRDSEIDFTAENTAWAKQFAGRMACRRALAKEGLIFEAPDGDAWGAIL